jgi:hypothetical protein
MPIATVAAVQTEQGGLLTNVKNEFLNHLQDCVRIVSCSTIRTIKDLLQ